MTKLFSKLTAIRVLFTSICIVFRTIKQKCKESGIFSTPVDDRSNESSLRSRWLPLATRDASTCERGSSRWHCKFSKSRICYRSCAAPGPPYLRKLGQFGVLHVLHAFFPRPLTHLSDIGQLHCFRSCVCPRRAQSLRCARDSRSRAPVMKVILQIPS